VAGSFKVVGGGDSGLLGEKVVVGVPGTHRTSQGGCHGMTGTSKEALVVAVHTLG
jgi:hypothetical protein